jgi:asparagine synthase (glutamine-hydrolysing)
MASLRSLSVSPICYTFSGLAERTLDERLAARVAAVAGLEHHVLRVAPDFLSRYGHWVDRTVFLTDGCAGATASHEIYLNALARSLSKVRVTGNFGSEVLRGMSTFKPLGLSGDLATPEFRESCALAAREGGPVAQHPVSQAAFNEIPKQLFGTWCAARTQLTVRTPYLDNELVRIAYQSPEVSRRSPVAAIHLVNSLDPRMGRIATDRGITFRRRDPIRWARRSLEYAAFKLDYWYQEGLPRRVALLEPALERLGWTGLLGRHKYLPYRRWFRRELAPYVAQVLHDDATMRMPYWNRAFLRTAPNEHASGRRNLVREINAVLQMDAARRVLLNPAPVPSQSPVPISNR